MSDKLINTFHQRRKLNAEIEALGATSTETELLDQVRALVKKYEPDLILATLRKHLDTASSQLRGGLGRLAVMLPYEEITAAMRHEAANRANPTQARLTAALILERFLQAELPPALMSDLKDPETVVMQSLQEAIEEGHQNRYVLLDYVRQMRQESEDVGYMVLELLTQLPAVDQLPLLRLIAYDMRADVAQLAIDQLAALRQPTVQADAAEALHTLQMNLAPRLAERAERSLRKMRFSGVTYTPPPLSGWRALLTPCGLAGDQDLWFIQANKESGTLIGVRLNVNRGLLESFGSEEIETRYLPPHREIGEMISIAITSGVPTVFLEVHPAYAQWHLRQVLATHWQQSPARPLPDEYTLHNPYLSRYALADLTPDLVALLAAGPDLWQREGEQVAESAGELLRHPAMGSWFLQEPPMKERVRQMAHGIDSTDLSALVSPLMAEMFAHVDADELIRRLQRALHAQAAWLAIAGHERSARQAVLLAESLRHLPIVEHPLLELMVEMGMMLLLNRRAVR